MNTTDIENEARRLYPNRDIHRYAFKKGVAFALGYEPKNWPTTDSEINKEADAQTKPGMESFNGFVAGAKWMREVANPRFDELQKDCSEWEKQARDLAEQVAAGEARVDAFAEDLDKSEAALKDCRAAIEWALNNTTADHESVQSDFFNILMNARTAADRILNPEFEENKPFDPKQELNF